MKSTAMQNLKYILSNHRMRGAILVILLSELLASPGSSCQEGPGSRQEWERGSTLPAPDEKISGVSENVQKFGAR